MIDSGKTPLYLAALLAVILAVGCVPSGWSWVATTPNPTAHVAVVGDSLTWQAEHGSSSTTDPHYLRHYLIDELNARGWAARVAAKSGATTASLKLWGQWASPPDVIVMALGTNDLYYKLPADTSQANVRSYLDRWPLACPVLVGVKPSAPRGIEPSAWNAWLAAEAAARGGVYVDWAGISAGHGGWFTSDLLHHTTAGQAAYRAAILNGVNQCTDT